MASRPRIATMLSMLPLALILAQGRSSRLRGYLLLGGYSVIVVAFFVAGDRT